MYFFDDIDDIIFNLREQGNNYDEISKLLKKQDIKLKPFMVEERCKVIYERKNMKEPAESVKEIIEVNEKKEQEAKKEHLQELVFELREQGKTYKQISEYIFREKGIKKCISDIRDYYLDYCKKMKIAEPKKRINVSQKVSSEEIFKLRESGYSCRDIIAYYKEKGIKISKESVQKIYKEECERLGKEYKSKVKLRKKCKEIIQLPDEKIFELREKKLTYDEIVDWFKENGIKVTKETIRKRCKRIYAEKGMAEPRLKHKFAPENVSVRFKIPVEELIYLKKQGLSNKQILEYYRQKGLNIGIRNINLRCSEAYEQIGTKKEKGQRNRKFDVIISEDELFELREKRFSYTKIANYYKEKGIKVSGEAIRKRYIKARAKKQASLVELNNTLNNLLIKKQKTEQLLQQFTSALINIKNKKEDLENEK